MAFRPESNNSHNSIITLEVVAEDQQNTDPALVDAVGRDTTDALRNDGYTIEPIYTGQRGGFLVDVLIPIVNNVWTNKDVILADGSALVTIMTPVVMLIQHLCEAHEKRIGKEGFQQAPIKITIEMNGASILIEAPDLKTAESALNLARRFQAQHPAIATQVTSQSHVKVTGRVPKRPLRK